VLCPLGASRAGPLPLWIGKEEQSLLWFVNRSMLSFYIFTLSRCTDETGEFQDQGDAKWIVIRGPSRGHNDTPFGRPTPFRPISCLGLEIFLGSYGLRRHSTKTFLCDVNWVLTKPENGVGHWRTNGGQGVRCPNLRCLLTSRPFLRRHSITRSLAWQGGQF
jgi:hypothetical protein